MTKKTLEQLYKEHKGRVSDRWSSYLFQYERIFSEYRNGNVRLLEIGIQNGGSLEIWAKYFADGQKFVGCDINPDCARLVYDDPRIKVVVADANSEPAKSTIFGHSTNFDVIIDDGSHQSSDIVKSFATYFPCLTDGGVFVAEDLHCSYWDEFEGGLFDPFSSIAFFKRLADIVNYEHWGVDKTRSALLAGFFAKYGVRIDEESLRQVHSVEFVNSICVVRKMQHQRNTLDVRFIAGTLEEVVPHHLGTMEQTTSRALSQERNEWANRSVPPDEELSLCLQELAARDAQIVMLEQQQGMLNAELARLNTMTFGRGATRALAKFAPVGTRRRTVAKLMQRFATTLAAAGWRVAINKAHRHIRARTTSQFLPKTDDQAQLTAYFEGIEPASVQLDAQRAEALAFDYKPIISVIVPIYRVPQDVLDETIASLERQTYLHWEACLVWGDSEDPAGWTWLQARTSSDRRFKLKQLSKNGGISHNSNVALELAQGEYIALLDHDDTLTPWAFYEIAKRLQTSPELDFLYSDKDSITANGQIRLNALFKPEWSPEMLHSVNYLTHLNVIRTQIVRDIGGWRPETDGAQDWDLFFRVAERTRNIARVPSILYHWRILPTSTATGLHAKPYAAMGQLKAQQDYFMRRGLPALVTATPEGMFKIRWPASKAAVDIVVFQTGTLSQLIKALESLRNRASYAVRRVHVVHSSPVDRALDSFRTSWQSDIAFTRLDAPNWRSALEVALSDRDAGMILLLDGRASGISETLSEELAGWVTHHPDIAWASAIAINRDDTVYEAGRVVSDDYQSAPLFSGTSLYTFGWFGGPLWFRNMRACSPYAVAMKAGNARKGLSSLDESSMERDDFTAFCLALSEEGQRGLINPFGRVYFNEAPEKDWPNNAEQFHCDPYFNPAFVQVSPLRLQS